MKKISMNKIMMKAILDDSKVQFRKVIKNIRKDNLYEDYLKAFIDAHSKHQIGDVVRFEEKIIIPAKVNGSSFVAFGKVTNVRVERLWDMRNKEKIKEGISEFKSWSEFLSSHQESSKLADGLLKLKTDWIDLWNSTAPKGYKWEDNPYVFVYEFERVEL